MTLRKFRDDLESDESADIARLKEAIPELAPLPDLADAWKACGHGRRPTWRRCRS